MPPTFSDLHAAYRSIEPDRSRCAVGRHGRKSSFLVSLATGHDTARYRAPSTYLGCSTNSKSAPVALRDFPPSAR